MTPPTPKFPPGPSESLRPISNRRALARDILWDRPIFRAPALPNPRVTAHPQPFTVARVTHHQQSAVSG